MVYHLIVHSTTENSSTLYEMAREFSGERPRSRRPAAAGRGQRPDPNRIDPDAIRQYVAEVVAEKLSEQAAKQAAKVSAKADGVKSAKAPREEKDAPKKAQKEIDDSFKAKKEELLDQLTEALSNILLGEKIPLDVVNSETGEIIIPANRKITKTLLKKLATVYDRIEIDRVRDGFRQRIEPCMQVRGLAGLDQPEMAFRQDQARLAGQGAQYGQADALHALSHQALVPGARDLVQDHAGDADARIVELAAQRDRRHRLRSARNVDDEHDGPAGQRRNENEMT